MPAIIHSACILCFVADSWCITWFAHASGIMQVKQEEYETNKLGSPSRNKLLIADDSE